LKIAYQAVNGFLDTIAVLEDADELVDMLRAADFLNI